MGSPAPSIGTGADDTTLSGSPAFADGNARPPSRAGGAYPAGPGELADCSAMTPEEHTEFTSRVVAAVERDPMVFGVVALGSSAGTSRPPDRFSDHDLFLVVEAEGVERYRSSIDWMPEPERVVLSYRETDHAVKVVYDDGHLVEAAVFSPDEVFLARMNDYAVLFDRADVEQRMAGVREATLRATRTEPSDEWLAGQFLTGLLVGTSRYRRGEALSGHTFVKQHAAGHLAVMLWRHLAPADVRRDDLDPTRRLEQALPAVGAAIEAAMQLPVPDAAAALLDIAETELAGLFGAPALATTRRVLAAEAM